MAQITLRDYLQETEDAISSNRIDDALTHCQHMLSFFPEVLEIQRLLGEVYLAQGRLEEARHLFDWVLTNDPENVIAYCNRATVSERMSEFDVALDCYQQAYELNRGNGQIRGEFNRLSEKVGQKGFMLSRAGLARLYMRGDLLSQAIQEWDAVLATTPDRLDARTGLLETYWRAGFLDNVEELAEQILHDVPGCLKALLLKASVIASKDSLHTQELLGRAEPLDPDHILAQELFADALVSHPDDPFLQQLKKAPVLLPPVEQAQGLQEQSPRPQQDPFTPIPDSTNVSASNSSIIDKLAQWGQDAYGSNDTTLIKPRSAPASVASENSIAPQMSWNTPIQDNKNAQSSQETPVGSTKHSLEPWELLQNALNQFDANDASSALTANPASLSGQGAPLWENLPDPIEVSQSDIEQSPYFMPKQQESVSLSGIGPNPWNVSTPEPIPPATENIPNPPSWLNMLTQETSNAPSALTLESQPDNQQPLTDTLREQLVPSNPTTAEAQNLDSIVSPAQPLPPTIGFVPMVTEEAEIQPSWLRPADTDKVEDDEESSFGPSWLKSLGATTMAEEEPPATTLPPAPTASTTEAIVPHVAQPEPTDWQYEEQQTPSVPETNPYELWSQPNFNNSPKIYEQTPWIVTEPTQESQNTPFEIESSLEHSYTSGPLSSTNLSTEQSAQKDVEQNLVTTLEELEQSLRSKGFIPLENNSLTTLAAQTEESPTSAHDADTMKAAEGYEAQDFQQAASKQEQQEPQEAFGTLSLSSALAQLGNFTTEPPPPTTPSLASSFETLDKNDEPSWLQALKTVPSPTIPAIPTTPTWPDPSIEPYAPATYQNNLPETPSVQREPIATPPNNPLPPVEKQPPQIVQSPAMQANPLLENELETTMKRPAIRLQPLQKQTSPSQRAAQPHIISRSQSRERIQPATPVAKPTNENPSYQDRLVKGYQYQLVGNYDEAMQQYRFIIRGSNDLLAEVISNLRALLKLAPNYAPGYRVLGDAYMRQGEYLQARDVYEKALTATKRIKSQV